MSSAAKESEATIRDQRIVKFNAFYERYHPWVVKVAQSRFPAQFTEIIASSAMSRAWFYLDGLELNSRRTTSWLTGATVSASVDVLRPEGRHHALSFDTLPKDQEPSDPSYAPETLTLQAERTQILWNSIGALPEERRRVVELSLFHGVEEADTATILEIPRGSVKSHLNRARKTLKKSLAAINDPEHNLAGLGRSEENYIPEMFTGLDKPLAVKPPLAESGRPPLISRESEWRIQSSAALLRDAVLANGSPLSIENDTKTAQTVKLIQIEQTPLPVDRVKLAEYILDEETRNIMLNVAIRISRNRWDAEEAVQNAQFSAWQSLGQFKGGSVRAWLLRILVNKATDAGRRRQRHPETEFQEDFELSDSDPAINPVKKILGNEILEAVHKAMNTLPDDQQVCVELCDIQGMTYEQIAEIENTAVGTIKSRLSRARAKIRGYLTENYPALVDQFENPKPVPQETAAAS